MRVQDIIVNETDIVEAPAGMLGQIGRKLGAKALGAIGAKGKAAELTGKAEVGDEANQLKTALRGYAGKAGINIKQLQGPQLAAFLKSKGYPNMHLKDVQGIMTPKQIDQAVMQAAQDAAKADGDPGKGVSTAPAQPSAPGTATPGQVQKGQVVMFDTPDGGVVQGSVISTDGKTAKVKGPTKTYNVSNDQLKDVKTGKPLVNQGTNVAASGGQGAPGQGTSVAGKPTSPQVDKNKDGKDDNTGKVIPMPKSIPPEVQKQLDALSPTEKKVLAGAL